jgi:SanA protein
MIKRRILWLLMIGSVLLVFPYAYISLTTYSACTDDPEELGDNLLLVVLGTSKYLTDGGENPYYLYRIEAAIKLYKTGKVSRIIVSGHGGDKYYDEPRQMEQDLLAAGVPEDRIVQDPDGLRTILSVRALKHERGENIVFVSQRFHNERAVYLAHKEGIEARAYDASSPSARYMMRMWFREVFARQFAFWETLLG